MGREACATCGGSGFVSGSPCAACAGTGRSREQRPTQVMFEGLAVRNADVLPPGLYWALRCVRVEGEPQHEEWLELTADEPRRGGLLETTHGASLGVVDGVVRSVWCVVDLDGRRRVRRAFGIE